MADGRTNRFIWRHTNNRFFRTWNANKNWTLLFYPCAKKNSSTRTMNCVSRLLARLQQMPPFDAFTQASAQVHFFFFFCLLTGSLVTWAFALAFFLLLVRLKFITQTHLKKESLSKKENFNHIILILLVVHLISWANFINRKRRRLLLLLNWETALLAKLVGFFQNRLAERWTNSIWAIILINCQRERERET